jgi:hypothetical protein
MTITLEGILLLSLITVIGIGFTTPRRGSPTKVRLSLRAVRVKAEAEIHQVRAGAKPSPGSEQFERRCRSLLMGCPRLMS